MKKRERFIFDTLYAMFPDADCELNFSTVEELAIAVMLSAQTTDVAVNKVTNKLFRDFLKIEDYANAEIDVLESYLKTIGLYRNKARYLKAFAEKLLNEYGGKLPSNPDQLESLPGIGHKTAQVVLAVGFNIPALAVDTHVHRVSQRLGLVEKSNNVLITERQLKKLLPKNEWIKAHHALLFFGRYHCTAKNPKCYGCPLGDICPCYVKEKQA